MTGKELKAIVECGETSFVQFKREFSSQKEIAKEMVAFANGGGGRIIFGIEDKNGEMVGLTYEEAQKTNNELGNTANEQIKPTVYIQTETIKVQGKLFVVCEVKKGKDKPYKNLSGEIWIKQGADKRRVTENNEILSLFQESGIYKPELSPVEDASIEDLDMDAVENYFMSAFGKKIADFGMPLAKLLRSQKIIDDERRLTTVGAMFFCKNPQLYVPWFVVKAVSYEGNDIGGSVYRDSRDIVGSLPKMFEDTLNFLKTNLHYVQKGQNFNKVGILEIPEVVLEEILQNAMVHLDINSPAAIRVLLFDNRLEIINSGALCDDIDVEAIKLGISKQRNPQMAMMGNRTMIYRGLGSGIPRVLKEDVKIDFENQVSANQFKVILWRESSDKSSRSSDKYPNGSDNLPESSDNIVKSSDNIVKSSDNIAKSSDKYSKSSDKKELILQYLRRNKRVRTTEVKAMLNVSESYARRLLSGMVDDGILKALGENKNRCYEIKK